MRPRCLIGARPLIRALVLALLVAATAPGRALAEDAPGAELQPAEAGREAKSLLRELRQDQAREPAAGQALAPDAPVRRQAERMRGRMDEDRKARRPGKAARRRDGNAAGPINRGICIGCR
ncbi:hypothetical protein [Methylobacterium soli]|uniref:Uncharacterized protein n=1 Tax=Methylobacterium soli TaxID=553447 RepID=A0A6L3SZD6_9HYPH|nr:hypothetical protein [Methylobacterium soli]KAB1079543.1 hypothetical protein F6X53_09605 [Methylobacterium soli]GJE42023.1 hypothetical protein AEGHOMDF_1193 [Methylobacterium soli]